MTKYRDQNEVLHEGGEITVRDWEKQGKKEDRELGSTGDGQEGRQCSEMSGAENVNCIQIQSLMSDQKMFPNPQVYMRKKSLCDEQHSNDTTPDSGLSFP